MDQASKGTSGSKAAKTGDPANVLGLLGLAFSSLGAGVGGFAWKRKKKIKTRKLRKFFNNFAKKIKNSALTLSL